MLEHLLDRAARALHMCGAVLLLALTIVICYDVAGRLLFNHPFAGTAELAGVALVLVTFMQTPYIIREHKLLRVTFLVDRVGPRARSYLNAFAALVGALFFGAIALTSIEPAWHGWQSGEFFGTDAYRVPAWPLRWGTIALWLLAMVVSLQFLIEGLRGRLTQHEEQLPE